MESIGEFFKQDGDTLGAPLAVPDREVDRDLFGVRSVLEEDLDRVPYIALVRVEVVFGESGVFAYLHACAQRIHACGCAGEADR